MRRFHLFIALSNSSILAAVSSRDLPLKQVVEVLRLGPAQSDLIRRGVPKSGFATLEGARLQMEPAELGWNNTVSTTAWYGSMTQYYNELAAAA